MAAREAAPQGGESGANGDLSWATLAQLLRAELGAGILGLRLFMACVAVAAAMLGGVWVLGDGLSTALERNGLRMLGGDLAISMANTPLEPATVGELREIGTVSHVVELRTSAAASGLRGPVELKAVDGAYPLYGTVGLDGAESLAAALEARDGRPGAVVAPGLLARFGLEAGDTVRLGSTVFEIRGVLTSEPDRLASGRFLVGPRVIVDLARLEGTGLTGLGALAEHRYRLRLPDGTALDAARADVEELAPRYGWEVETPQDAGDRVRRTVDRTTTFLGVAGIVALAIGLAGAWAAATVWIARRARTVALYRLSGATPALVVALHAVIVAIAGAAGVSVGLGIAVAGAVPLMEMIAARLHLAWDAGLLVAPALTTAAVLVLGLAGASIAALSTAARMPPGAAMRGGEAILAPRPAHVALGAVVVALAAALAVLGLPEPGLAATAAAGLAGAAVVLGAGGWAIARLAAARRPRGFVGLATVQALSAPGAAAMKALAIGIGIAGITGVVAAQSSLEGTLRTELPANVPDLVLIDVQPDQVADIRRRISGDAALGGVQATPYMRASILAVNGTPAEEALVAPDDSWVIEGDRSFSWAAEPTGEPLIAGEWWAEDYAGPPLISAGEDVQEAFDLAPGDTITYSVLGRTFTSEVANVRRELHRTFRPEFLLVASPDPFRQAPHSWIVTLQGETDAAVDTLIRDLADSAPNVTSIDARRIVAQVREIVDGAVMGSLAVAATLLVAGALSLAAVVAADVDARRREALAYTLIGASRREIALARLADALTVGALAAVLGGIAGHLGGYWLVDEALYVPWRPGAISYVLPVALGALAAAAAGIAGGIGAVPRGRGRVVRLLAS